MPKDLIGKRFGRLTVIKLAGIGVRSDGQKYRTWLCKCDCGNEKVVRTSYLTCGETKSCGCLHSDVVKNHYEGKKFGNLTVIKESGRDNQGNVIYLCKCDCGNEFETSGAYLRRGYSTSCGCKTSEKLSESSKTHGLSNTKLFYIWEGMKSRCYNPNNNRYNNYGGRGIKVCEEWKNDFKNFYDWALNSGYNENASHGECTLDRIDVNGNYAPNNCRWITNKEQQNNRRNNICIEYHGEIKTLAEWSEIIGINYNTLKCRIKILHWSVEKAFETPVKLINKTNEIKE